MHFLCQMCFDSKTWEKPILQSSSEAPTYKSLVLLTTCKSKLASPPTQGILYTYPYYNYVTIITGGPLLLPVLFYSIVALFSILGVLFYFVTTSNITIFWVKKKVLFDWKGMILD